MRLRSALLAGVFGLALSGCGRNHTLIDGKYAFATTRVVRDDCALSAQPGIIGTGKLTTTGDRVRIDYSLFDTSLFGAYLADVEKLFADGSAPNVNTTVRGADCLINLVTIHLDAESVDSKNLTGQMSFKYEASRPECVCELWESVSANLTEASPMSW